MTEELTYDSLLNAIERIEKNREYIAIPDPALAPPKPKYPTGTWVLDTGEHRRAVERVNSNFQRRRAR